MANAFNIDKGGSTTSDTHLINETFHVFSKSPGSPTTSLGGARLKSGHTTTTSDVWADEIPAFFKAATQAKFDLFSTKAVKDDLCLFNGNVYQHNGTEFVSLGTEAEVLIDGATFKKNDKDVVKFHKGRTAINLTADNNNGDGSNDYTAKIYDAATGSTTFVPQFISAMDKMVDGIPSLAYDAAVFAGGSQLAEGLTADNDYICNAYAGVIQFNKARSSGVTVNAWEYIGAKLDTTVAKLNAAVFGSNGGTDPTVDLITQVNINTSAIATLNGDVNTTGSVIKQISDATLNSGIQGDNLIQTATGDAASKLVTAAQVKEYVTENAQVTVTVGTTNKTSTGFEFAGDTGTDVSVAAAMDANGKVTYSATLSKAAVDPSTGAITNGELAVSATDAKTIADKAISTSLIGTTDGTIGKAISDVESIANGVSQTVIDIQTSLSTTYATKSYVSTAISGATSTTGIVDNDASTKLVTAKQVSEYVASEVGAIDTGVTSISVNGGGAQKGAVSITVLEGVTEASHTGINSASIGISNESNKVKLTAVSAGAKVEGDTLSYLRDTDYLATAADADVIATFRAEEAKSALADTAITGDDLSVTGSGISVTLGGTVGAPTLTGSVTTATYTPASEGTAGSWTNNTNVATGAEVAKAIADVNNKIDTLHSAAVTYKVFATKPEPSAEYKGIIALVPIGEGESAVAGGYVEWLCVETVGESGAKSYSWEQIGTTAAELTQYAKSVTVNGTKTSVTAATGDINIGKVASSVTAGNGVESGSVSDAGALSLTLTTASTETAGITTLTAEYNDEEDDKAATGKSIAAAIETLDSNKSVNGITVTQTNGVIESITEELITASIPAGTTSVVGNVAYVGSTKHVIAPEKFETAAQMPESLTSWVADLTNLTVGDNMFKGCTGLTTFIGDLDSLTSGVDMFNGCTLDAESLEILADTLPTVTSGTIDFGASTNATADEIATIKGKGWTLKSNGADVA